MPISTSSSKAQDDRIVATDQAKVAGRKGRFTESGSFQVGDKAKLNTGLDVGSVGGDLTIQSDQGAVAGAIDLIKQTSADLSGSLGQLIAAQSAVNKEALGQTGSIVDAVLGAVSGLAESKQTEGASGQNKLFLWLALAGLAVIAWVLTRRS